MAHSGYDKQRFVNLPHEQFDCVICAQVAKDPYQCEYCGRMFCKLCITDWLKKNPTCPNRCSNINNSKDSGIAQIRSKALKRAYNALQIKCINCQKPFLIEALKNHQQACSKNKCWNFSNCNSPTSQAIKYTKPCCSYLCMTVHLINSNQKNQKKLFEIITNFMNNLQQNCKPIADNSPPKSISNKLTQPLCWSLKYKGDWISLSQNNCHAFLNQQAYVFRTVIANIGFTSGINYWEIIADQRTENQMKIGIISKIQFDLNSAFSDMPTGWAYYGLGQLRHHSNAVGPTYGKRFKKQGVLGICLDMNKGTLSYALNGQNMGVAYTDDELKTGIFYPAVALLHCAGCKIRGGVPVPSWFS